VSTQVQRLTGPVQIAAAATSYYTAESQTRLDKVTVSNPAGNAAAQVTLFVGNAAVAATEVQPARNVQPGEAFDVWPLEGHVLNIGDQLWALASAATTLNLLVSGTLVSGS
jgi:hypothetical protein